MADEIQILDISKNDTIRTAFDKINYNFDQLILHGGGAKGDQGKTGSHGPRGLTGSKIYALDEAIDLQLSGAENMDKIDPQIAIGDYVITTKGIYQFVDMPDSFTTVVKWDSLIEGSSIINKLRESQNSSPVVTQSASIASDGLWTTVSRAFMRPVSTINGPVIGNKNSSQYKDFASKADGSYSKELEGSAAVILADSKISFFDSSRPEHGYYLLYGSSHQEQRNQTSLVLINDRLRNDLNLDFTNNQKSFWNLYKSVRNKSESTSPHIAARIAHDSIAIFQTIGDQTTGTTNNKDRWRFFAGYEAGHWAGSTDFLTNEFAGYIIDTGENVNITGDNSARLRSVQNTSLELYNGGEDNSSNTYIHLLKSASKYPNRRSDFEDENRAIEMRAPRRVSINTPCLYTEYPVIYKQQDLRFTGHSGYNWLGDYEYFEVKNHYGCSMSLKIHNGHAEFVLDIHYRGDPNVDANKEGEGIFRGILDTSDGKYKQRPARSDDFIYGSWQLPNSPKTSDLLYQHYVGLYFGDDNHHNSDLTIEFYDGPEYFKRTWNRYSHYINFLETEVGVSPYKEEKGEKADEAKCQVLFASGGIQLHGYYLYFPHYCGHCRFTMRGNLECIRQLQAPDNTTESGVLDWLKTQGYEPDKEDPKWLYFSNNSYMYTYESYWFNKITKKVTLILNSVHNK